MSLLHIHLYLIYYNCYFPISSSLSFSFVTLSLHFFFLPSIHCRYFFIFFFLILVTCSSKNIPSYIFSFESLPIYIHLCATVFTSSCHPQEQQQSLSLARERTPSKIFMWYMNLYSSQYYTLNQTERSYHLFRIAVKSCTDVGFIAQQQILLVLVTPGIILHGEHHLLASNYLYRYVDTRHFSILEPNKINL